MRRKNIIYKCRNGKTRKWKSLWVMLNYIFRKNFPSNWQQIILILLKLHSISNFHTLFCSLCIPNKKKRRKNSKPLNSKYVWERRRRQLLARYQLKWYVRASVSRLKGFSGVVCSVRNCPGIFCGSCMKYIAKIIPFSNVFRAYKSSRCQDEIT